MENFFLFLAFTFVSKNDFDSLIQECHFSQSVLQSIIIVFCRFLENFRVRPENSLRTCLFRFAYDCKRRNGFTSLIFLSVNVAVSLNFNFHLCGKSINNGSTYTVETAGNFISSAAEFTAGMKNSMNNFNSRNTKFRVVIYRHTSTVVFYHNRVIFLNGYIDRFTVTSKRFVHTVVYNFVYQMMEPSGSGTAYVHTRSFANCFQTFQYLDLGGVILILIFLFFAHLTPIKNCRYIS